MAFEQSKTGAGNYAVKVADDGKTWVKAGPLTGEFDTAQAAYDYLRPLAMRGDGSPLAMSAWNVCYAIETHLEDGQ